MRLTREESRQRTRERLRKAAYRNIVKGGVRGTSIDAIAQEAGYSRGAFYANYSSKRALLLELLDEQQSGQIDLWRNVIEESASIEDCLSFLEDRTRDHIAKAEWGLFNVEIQLEAERDPEFAAEYRIYAARLRKQIEGMLAALFRRAGRKPPADLSALAAALRSFSIGLNFHAAQRLSQDRDNDPAAMMLLYLRGLLAVGAPLSKNMEEGSGGSGDD